jgi:Tol biopolymer transport system component
MRWNGGVGIVVFAFGCGSVGETKVDARVDSPAVDSAIDSPTGRCDPTKPFGAPVPVEGVNTAGTTAGESAASLTSDELNIYFASNRLGPGSANFDLYSGSRTAIDQPFTNVQKLTLSVDGDERSTWISNDQMTIYFHSSAGGDYELYTATRSSTSVPFGTAVPLGVNMTGIEVNPRVSADGQTLFFERQTTNSQTLHQSTRGGNGFSTDSPIAALNPDAGGPVPSADGLSLYFDSSRGGDRDIWVAKRTSTSAAFTQISQVTELARNGFDIATWVSADDCHLYMTTTIDGGFSIYMAARPQ